MTKRHDHILYVCHRAKCDFEGGIGNILPHAAKNIGTPKPQRRVWEGKTYDLPQPVLKRIEELWGISEPEHWWWTTDYGGRVAMSIRSPKYRHRGWLLRDIAGRDGPKALTYVDEGEQGLSWYKPHPHCGTVLVEDIPSAVRASRYVNSVALLGTGIGVDRAIEIGEYAPRPIVLALDQDATDLSFRWAKKYALLWGDVKVLPLKKDLKDSSEAELEEKLTRM